MKITKFNLLSVTTANKGAATVDMLAVYRDKEYMGHLIIGLYDSTVLPTGEICELRDELDSKEEGGAGFLRSIVEDGDNHDMFKKVVMEARLIYEEDLRGS